MFFCRVVDFHIVTSIELFPVAQAQVMASHHDTLVFSVLSSSTFLAQMMAGTRVSRDVAVVESGENRLSRLKRI